MSTNDVPAAYHHEITSKRADLASLGACSREFMTHFSPRAVLLGLAVALAVRAYVGGWSWRDAIPLAVLIAAQPFVEWVIHKYLLHLPPLRVLGRRIELYGSIQHREHHRAPSDLERVLLKPIEVVSFLVQIAILVPLVTLAVAIPSAVRRCRCHSPRSSSPTSVCFATSGRTSSFTLPTCRRPAGIGTSGATIAFITSSTRATGWA